MCENMVFFLLFSEFYGCILLVGENEFFGMGFSVVSFVFFGRMFFLIICVSIYLWYVL